MVYRKKKKKRGKRKKKRIINKKQSELKKKVLLYQKDLAKVKEEVSKIVVGQGKILKGLLRAIVANGHVLVEGVPGVAKTLMIRSLAESTGCKFNRIQFTVDLLPTDIVGITTYDQRKGFTTVKGPIFANFVIADEINRAPPKTQSALLEAMGEHQATISKKTYKLDQPFFVMATQNTIESSGTYPLPEAQVDRFLFNLLLDYPDIEEEREILKKNISIHKLEDFNLKPVMSASKIVQIQKLVKKIFLNENVEKYIVRIVNATRNPDKYNLKFGKYIELGGSPRASIYLFIAAKAEALLCGDSYVKPQHVKNIAHDVLRHRIRLNYEAQAEGITTNQVIDEILKKVPVP